MTVTCPHCQEEIAYKALDHINIDQNPELRDKVQDLSCFRVMCPNCRETALVVQPCLYHDMSNRFMVWLLPEENGVPKAKFDPAAGYMLRKVDSLNAFREKINILEYGLDDRAVELMKLLLYMQLNRDMDVVELLFHEHDANAEELRFAAVLSDGAEQYVSMPVSVYQRLRDDVETYLFTVSNNFVRVDMDWAKDALELLHEIY